MSKRMIKSIGKKLQPYKCCHFWQIEPPDGVKSLGICKHCGKRKYFYNTMQPLATKAMQANCFLRYGQIT